MHARALEPGADHHFTAGLHHAGRGAEALFVELWIAHAVSIVPDVADTFPCLFVLACVAMQRLHQGFQAALIEFQSEEHTSELQSQSNLVCRLLLEKKITIT